MVDVAPDAAGGKAIRACSWIDMAMLPDGYRLVSGFCGLSAGLT